MMNRHYFSDEEIIAEDVIPSEDEDLEVSYEEDDGENEAAQLEVADETAEAIEDGNELIMPPCDPIATANLISMVDPDKVEEDDISVIAEATGSSPEFVGKVIDLVAQSVIDADETTQEAAQENYSNRVFRLCNRVNFSDMGDVPEGKSEEEKLTEVVDIIPTFADEVLQSVEPKEMAEVISAATGVAPEGAEAIINVAKAHINDVSEDDAVAAVQAEDGLDEETEEVLNEADGAVDNGSEYIAGWEDIQQPGDTYIEDHDEYAAPMHDPNLEEKVEKELALTESATQQNFSFYNRTIVDDLDDAWRSTKKDVATAAHQASKAVISAIKDTPVYDGLQEWNKVSLQPAVIKIQKTVKKYPGRVVAAAVSPLAVASLVGAISEIVSKKAAAEEEEELNHEENAEALDNAAISTGAKATVSLANAARIHMSRHFSAVFASDVYDDNRLFQLDTCKEDLANNLYELGAYFNNEQGFWSGLSDFISKYREAFGGALASILVMLMPKFVSVNGSQIILGAKNKSFFDKLSNIFNRDPAWIKGLRSLDKYIAANKETTVAATLIALGSAVAAWLKANDASVDSLPESVKNLMAKVKYNELKIADIESQMGGDVASDLVVATQPKEVLTKAFSRRNFDNAEQPLDNGQFEAEDLPCSVGEDLISFDGVYDDDDEYDPDDAIAALLQDAQLDTEPESEAKFISEDSPTVTADETPVQDVTNKDYIESNNENEALTNLSSSFPVSMEEGTITNSNQEDLDPSVVNFITDPTTSVA